MTDTRRRAKAGMTALAIALAMVLAAVFVMPAGSFAATAKKPEKVSGLKAATTYNSVTVKWSKAKNAKTYDVYRATKKDGSYKKLTNVKGKTYTDKDLQTGKKYWYKVRGVNGKKTGKKSSAVSAVPSLATPTIKVNAEADGVQLKVSKKISGAEGYIFYRDGEAVTDQTELEYVDLQAPVDVNMTYTVEAYRMVEGDRVKSEASAGVSATRPQVMVQIEQVTAPSGKLIKGMPFTIKGKITANVNIKKVEAGCILRDTGEWASKAHKIQDNYDADSKLNEGNPREFRILRKIDSYVKFGSLAVGSYDYRVIATLTNGTQKTLVDQDFEIVPLQESPEVTGGAKLIVDMAKELAWPYGTSTSTYKYSGGSATEAFQQAIDVAYPNRSGWGKKPKVGASCDVFVGTVVRVTGYDKTFPRGLSDVESHMKKYPDLWEKHTDIRTADKMLPGDIVYMKWTTSGTSYGHIMIYLGNNRVANAHYGSGGRYGIIEKASSQIRTDTSTRKVKKFYVYRALK